VAVAPVAPAPANPPARAPTSAPAAAVATRVDEPDAPTRLAPDTEPARIGVAPSEPVATEAVAPAAPTAPAPELPGPFAVSFASGDPAISQIEVRCGSVSASGSPPVALPAAPKGSCKVTGLGGPSPLITLVTLTADRAYTCFAGGGRSCK